MKSFSRETMRSLQHLDTVIDMKEYEDDLRKFSENNIRNEKKKTPKFRRSDDVIIKHSATGLAAEKAVESIGFVSNCPIVEDSSKIKFNDLMTDHTMDGLKVAVKSTNPNHKYMVVSDRQLESILRSCNLNDVFLIMNSENVESLKFSVTPRFLVDASKFSSYIKPSQYKKNSYYFSHAEAISHGYCIDLKESVYV